MGIFDAYASDRPSCFYKIDYAGTTFPNLAGDSRSLVSSVASDKSSNTPIVTGSSGPVLVGAGKTLAIPSDKLSPDKKSSPVSLECWTVPRLVGPSDEPMLLMRENLSSNPSLETDSSFWSPFWEATTTRSNEWSSVGTYSFKSTRTSGGHLAQGLFHLPSVSAFGPGDKATVGVTLMAPAGATVDVRFRISYYGTPNLSSPVIETVTLQPGIPMRVSGTYTIPEFQEGQTGIYALGFEATTSVDSPGLVLYADAATVEKGETPGTYFDSTNFAQKAVNLVTNPSGRNTSGTVTVRENIVLNPSLSVNSTGWTPYRWFGPGGGNGDYSSSIGTGGPFPGTGYRRKTWTVAPTGNGDTGMEVKVNNNTDNTGRFVCTAGDIITASGYLRPSSAGKWGDCVIYFYDSTGTQIGGPNTGSLVSLSAGAWTRVSHTVTAPSGAVRFSIIFDVDPGPSGNINWAVGDTLDGSCALIEKSALLSDYFDGTNPAKAARNLVINPSGRAVSGLVVVRENICDNPSFEVDVSRWGKYGSSTVSRDTTEKETGSASMKIVTTARPQGAYWVSNTTVTALTQIKATIKVKGTPGNSVMVSGRANNPDGTYKGESIDQRLVVFDGTWQTFSVGWTIGSDFRPGIQVVNTAANSPDAQTYWIDSCIIETSSVLKDYFDGSTDAGGDFTYGWTGTPHLSTSRQYAPRTSPVSTRYYGNNSYDLSGGPVYRTYDTPSGNPAYRFPSRVTGPSGFAVPRTPADPLTTYTAVFKTRAEVLGGSSVDVSLRVNFWNGGTYLSNSNSPTTVNITESESGTEFRYTFTTPASTTLIELIPFLNNGANEDVVDFYEFMIVKGTYSGSTFDGDTPDRNGVNYAWEGTPNNSISYSTSADFTYAWSGTAGASTSKQLAPAPRWWGKVNDSVVWETSDGWISVRSTKTGSQSAVSTDSTLNGYLPVRSGKATLIYESDQPSTLSLWQYKDNHTTYISQTNGPNSPAGVVRMTFNLAPGTTEVRPILFVTGRGTAVAGDTNKFRNITLIDGDYSGDPFDGSTDQTNNDRYAWTGTPDTSTSASYPAGPVTIMSHTGTNDGLSFDGDYLSFSVDFQDTESVSAKWQVPDHLRRYHLVGVYDLQKVSLYVNGELAAETSLTDEQLLADLVSVSDYNFYAGESLTNETLLFDAPAIYDYALPADKVLSHYLSGTQTRGPVENGMSFDGNVFTLNDTGRDIVYTQTFDLNSGLYDNVTNKDGIRPSVDDTGLSIAGVWTASIPIAVTGSTNLSGVRLDWNGDGYYTVESSLDGISWSPVANGGIIDGTTGLDTTDQEIDIRITFDGGYEDDISVVRDMSAVGYSSNTIRSDNSNMILTIPDGSSNSSEQTDLIESFSRAGTSLVDTASLSGDDQVQTVELWFKLNSTASGNITSRLYWNGSSLSLTDGTLYLNGSTSALTPGQNEWVHAVLVLNNPISEDVLIGGADIQVGLVTTYDHALTSEQIGRLYSSYFGAPKVIVAEPSSMGVQELSDSYLLYDYNWQIISGGR